LGGALGTLARYAAGRGFPTPAGHFPTTILVVNLSGSLLIGFLLPIALAMAPRRPLVRPFAVTGILGGWTTYSALATDGVALAKSGHALLAVANAGATVGGGLALVAIGFALSSLLSPTGP